MIIVAIGNAEGRGLASRPSPWQSGVTMLAARHTVRLIDADMQETATEWLAGGRLPIAVVKAAAKLEDERKAPALAAHWRERAGPLTW